MRYPIADDELIEEFIRPAAGPGGQHVNRTASGVRLHFAFETSPALPDHVKARIRDIAGSKLVNGELVFTAKESRSLKQNREAALRRLDALLETASHIPKTRRPTKPTRASKERRLASKSKHAEVKRGRQKTPAE